MLLLLPNLLGDRPHHQVFLPASVDRAVETLDGLIAESAAGGRRYLSRFKTQIPTNNIPIAVIKENMTPDEIDFYLKPCMEGQRWGLVSDAGLPCVADPGGALVKRARQLGIPVQAFIGPSSVMLGLMLSGLPGQRFSFHGYIAREPEERKKELLAMQKAASETRATQIFIEAPHRNKHVLETALETLLPTTELCVAWDLTMPTQGVVSFPIHTWRKTALPNIDKKPAIFLLN